MVDVTDKSVAREERLDAETVRVTPRSMFTREVYVIDLSMTESEERDWRSGMLIQRALPRLSADQREFLLTGSTPEEWDAVFGGADEEEDA